MVPLASGSDLSDLQLAVVRVLWDKGEASAAEVQRALERSRRLAITTVSTLLGRLERRGILTHRSEGRTFIYRARVSEHQMRRKAISGMIRNLFRGDPSEVVGHILSERDVSEEDLARMRTLIEEARRAEPRDARSTGHRTVREGGDTAMAIERNAAFLCAWLATYFAHSTLLLALALIATRKLSPRADRLAELVWRVALVLPVVTSLAQQLSPTAIAPPGSGLLVPTYTPQPLEAIRVPTLVWIGVASVWIAGALVGLSILFFARRELYQRIRGRSPLPLPRAREIEPLPGIRSIRVSLVKDLSIPLALAREICLPAWMLNRMSAPELRAVVAHELAHVRRGDAAWRPVAAAIARVFFFQPLNWIAASRLRELSECICDEEAIATTNSSIALASALEAVAARASRHSTPLLFAPAMGVGESLTLRRVARILSTTNVYGATHLPLSRLTQFGVAFIAAVVVALSAPRMTLPDIAFQRYTITASDGAGPFTLTLEKGRVVGATIAGRTVGAKHLAQRGTMVELVDRDARRLSVTLTPQGGIRWTGRRPAKPDR